MGPALIMNAASTDPASSQPRFDGDLAERSFRPGLDEVVLPPHRDRDRDQGRDADREPIEPDGVHADGGERDAQRHPDDAFAAHVEAVRAEAPHAGERAPPEVPGVVADEAEQEADEQQPVAVEEVLHDERAEDQGDDDEDRGQDAAELRCPDDDRTAADALERAGARAPA